MKISQVLLSLGGVSLLLPAFAQVPKPVQAPVPADLMVIYQEAAQNNGTYLAAESTYKAARYGLPISFSKLLPNVVLSANTTATRQWPNASPAGFNSNGYTLTLTQPLLAIGAWYNFGQAEATYKAAAVTYAGALQTLIMNSASDYFGVLEAQDQLQYAKANEKSLLEQMTQTEAQYKVGLKARTDVEAIQASYQSAVATTISDENALDDAYASLTALTGQPQSSLAALQSNFPLIKPNPQDMEAWVQFGLKNNLNVQAAALQSQIAKSGLKADAATGFLPTLSAVGTYGNSQGSPSAYASTRTTTKTGALQASWALFSGGSSYATLRQDQYTYQANRAAEDEANRDARAAIQKAYLNVLADIAQVLAYQQAVISNQASLKSMKAGYVVGTRTIVDVLTQQSNLFSSEQQYAQSIYQYITDSLSLKEQAGLLAPADMKAVNGWLVTSTPAAHAH
jgi:outer membrane protein